MTDSPIDSTQTETSEGAYEPLTNPEMHANMMQKALNGDFDPNDAKLTHTLLEIWDNILRGSENSRNERISPLLATKVMDSWPGKITLKDIPTYWALYHDYVDEMREKLTEIIADNPDALKKVDSDGEDNAPLYRELLFHWSNIPTRMEEEWDVAADDAGPRLAAIADAMAFFVGEQGLVEHLSHRSVKFPYTKEDQEALEERLIAARTERNGS